MGQQLLFKRKHRCVVPIHGHLYRKLKREVSRTEKRLKIATTSMFSRCRRRSRGRKEWICERRCQVSVSGVVYMYLRDCVALSRLQFTLGLHFTPTCVLLLVCSLHFTSGPQSAFYTDRFELSGSIAKLVVADFFST